MKAAGKGDDDSEVMTISDKRSEYSSILVDLKKSNDDRKKILEASISNVGSVDIASEEAKFKDMQKNAEDDLNSLLAKIDEDMYGSSSSQPDGVADIEKQIDLLEAEIKQLWDESDSFHKSKEEDAKGIKKQIREIENLIDPLQDAQRALQLEQRPLRREEMSFNKERMELDSKWDDLDERREEMERRGEDIREEIRDEMMAWEKQRRREVEDLTQDMWDEFEDENRDIRNNLEDQNEDIREKIEEEIEAMFSGLEDRYRELDGRRDNLEEAFQKEMESQRDELEGKKDELFAEKMAHLETLAKELDAELENKWNSLDDLYTEQEKLTSQLGEIEKRVRDLDRQAETGLINVISGALENAKELEKGKASSFESFLPQVGNTDKGD